MKAITTIILALAAVATAAPSPNADAVDAPLSARQSCSYSVLCNEDDEGEEPDPDTARCCAASGGSGDAFNCNGLSFTAAENMARCCGRSGGYTWFTSDPNNCAPITVIA
ncbi:hypothetical protein B0T18DRAFT_394024 [Schizothecium vesticola]|uniref:Uncharacterized protein n=1 Tax=Schizothecium vesticola TaxID=314040 RepID=A0AA40ELB3_9PEZI|nr:hypothetical protein B0T18DRAFT_394024 [Schizothecium vesticola]